MKFYQVALYEQPRGSMRPLAQRLGMSYDTLLAIRSGRVVPRPSEIDAIASALNVTPSSLLMKDVPSPVDLVEREVAVSR